MHPLHTGLPHGADILAGAQCIHEMSTSTAVPGGKEVLALRVCSLQDLPTIGVRRLLGGVAVHGRHRTYEEVDPNVGCHMPRKHVGGNGRLPHIGWRDPGHLQMQTTTSHGRRCLSRDRSHRVACIGNKVLFLVVVASRTP